MKNIKLKYLIPIVFLVISIIVSFSTYLFNINSALRAEENKMYDLIKQRIIERQGLFEAMIRKGDFDELHRVFGTVGATKELIHAFLTDENGNVIISSKRKDISKVIFELLHDGEYPLYDMVKEKNNLQIAFSKERDRIYAFCPVNMVSSSSIGIVKKGYYHEEYTLKRLKEELDESEKTNAFLPVLFFLFALIVTYFILYIAIAKNLKKIMDVLDSFSKGDCEARCAIDGKSEIALLAGRIDNMIEKIKYSNEELSRQFLKTQESLHLLEEYKKALDESNIVSKSDLKGNITYVNKKFCDISRYSQEELIGKPHNIVRHPDSQAETFKELWETVSTKRVWKSILKNRKKDGNYYWVDMMIMPILNAQKEITEYIAVRHDITDLIDQKKELENAAQTDALTGLGNRFKLINDIREAQSPAIALINIDNFREVNDFYGHRLGDFLIIELGNRIFDAITKHEGCRLYHLHGDEFAILSVGIEEDAFVGKVYKMITEISSATVTIESEEILVQLTASISFEQEKDDLFSTADMAMKAAKKTRKNILIYDEKLSLNEEYEKNIKWTKKLKNAIREDRLVPYFQPIVNNYTGDREKYECLVRMVDEKGEVISPYFFLEIAKRTKHYTLLTKTMIKKSFDTFKEMDAEFSINLTIADIMDNELKEYIFSMLEEYNIAERLVFEIVESEGIDNFDTVIEFIRDVKGCGCKIAIDDFGTGYSNFEYLMRLKADYIKIDGSMIKNIDTDEDSKAVVMTIVDFAKRMGIKTIAEFVKDEAIDKIVKELGIDYSQGYYYGEPRPKPER